MAKIFIIRHAQTTDNLENVFSGHRDPDLTDSGIEEAREIKHKLKDLKINKAYTSPQTRCKHTLEIVLEGHSGVEIIADPRIRERDYGELTGKNKEKIANLYPKEYPEWHRSYDIRPPGGESIKDVEERVMPFLKELIQNVRQNDVILVCASGNSIRPMRKHFENMTDLQEASYPNERGHIYSYEI
jgi:2,3-bisphosphoglycerate-dependent phosphoglycerate mutase